MQRRIGFARCFNATARGMAVTHETDFLDLYRQLGLNPGCELSEFKQAYRRRVALLHPDRQTDRPADARASARLQRLTVQYGAAMEFHRRHGRLPGSPAPSRAASAGNNERHEVVADPFAVPREAAISHHAARVQGTTRRRPAIRFAAVLAVAALGILGWSAYSVYSPSATGDASDDVAGSVQASAIERGDAADTPMLHLGMSADEVRAVEGDPVSMHGDLWEYGPSWVRFDHDRVVDWHSSPLRALHTGEKAMQSGR